MRYFITFCCYGARLHGEEAGSVDRRHNLIGSPTLEPDRFLYEVKRIQMEQEKYILDPQRRLVVLESIREVCQFRGWGLLAAHVRTNHVHVVVESEARPEKVMNDFKGYSSRRLNGLGLDEADRKRWARHGSTRWLWKDDDVRETIRYVVDRQGGPMAVFESEE